MEINFHSVDKISELTDSTFPFNLLFRKHFIGIAEDQNNTGEGIFINAKQDNPNILMIFHDMGESSKELIGNAEQLTNSFTDLFDFGKLPNNKIRLTADNKQTAQNLIADFFSIIDEEITKGGEELMRNLEDPKRLSDSIEQRENEKNHGNYIGATLMMEYGLFDSGYPLNMNHLNRLVEIYKLCGLHLPELIYIEDRVSNYGC